MTQPAAELQRSQGELRVRLRKLSHRTVLGDLYQQGCLKARIPRRSSERPLEVVTINTAGGLTDGDELRTSIEWDAGTRGVVTTQAAERVYHCRQDPALINTTLVISDNAIAGWLPQETILFDSSRLERRTNVELGENAKFFAVESLVFGRIAMQETVQSGQLFDRLQIRQDDRLVFADALALGGDEQSPVQEHLAKDSVLGNARCCATIVFAGNTDTELPDMLRTAIADSHAVGGASDLGSVITMRLLAADSSTLRELILRLYTICLEPFEFTEPRVWHC